MDIHNTDLKKINLGCGAGRLKGWMNVDIEKSYCDLNVSVDLTEGLPFEDGAFEHAFSSHFIEHLSYETTLFDFLKEVNRVLVTGGKLWVITPDLKKACQSYLGDKCKSLFEDRLNRNWRYKKKTNNPKLYNKIIDMSTPTQHFINDLFHQGGQHKNLLDIELLDWLAKKSGFSQAEEISDKILRGNFKEIRSRGDSLQAMYAVITK
jgi:predicted SAM-dependent methyltransferase